MNRREFLGAAISSGVVAGVASAQPASAKPPNVLVFFTDQQRWDTLGCYGNPMGLTPNLDRMAA